jgi:hypothetical protein
MTKACLRCRKLFRQEGKFNRICERCHARCDGSLERVRIPKQSHKDKVAIMRMRFEGRITESELMHKE